MNTKTACVIGAILVALAGAFFGGRSSKDCPQSLVPPESVKAPATKQLKPDTIWLERLIPQVVTPGDRETLWRSETLYIEAPNRYRQVFGNRWPHTGDSAIVYGSDSITLIPFGFVLQGAPLEADGASPGLPGGRKQPLLEIGGIWSWGGSDQFFATIPNPARDKRLFYVPQRVGVSFQQYQNRWGLTVSWAVF